MITEEISPRKEEFSNLTKDLYLSLLKEGKAIYVNARGMSMYPFIKNGDRIKIEPLKERKIKIGDIVAVDLKRTEGAWFFVHRTVKITEEDGGRIYFTKGDAHKSGMDKPINRELIVGRVIQIKRKNLEIDLGSHFWRYFNKIIAKFSLRYPQILIFFSKYINIFIEWKLVLSKLKNKFKKGNVILYNTEELLLICLRRDLSETLRKSAVDLIKEGILWKHFCKLTEESGLVFLVYHSLKTISPYAAIPQFVFDKLKSSYIYIISKSAQDHRELLSILKIFSDRDIPIIPLKGALLSNRLYDDMSARGLSSDIDLLVEEKNKEKARILLEENGYYIFYKEIEQWRWQYDLFKTNSKMLDLQWDITMMHRSDKRIEDFWQGSSLASEEGINYFELKEEELMLYLCVQFVNSRGLRKLRIVCDINAFLSLYKNILVWHQLIEKAQRWKMSNSLYLGLKLSQVFFKTEMPIWVLQKLKPNFLKYMWIKLFVDKKVILRNNFLRRLLDNFLSYIFFELIEAHTLKEYLTILKRVFFPPQEILNYRTYGSRIFKGLLKLLTI